MKILGINGWDTRSHDPSACIVVDGEIIAMIEEERLTRQRHSFASFPYQAIQFCLTAAGLCASDIDTVAFGWDYQKKYSLRGLPYDLSPSELLQKLFPSSLFPRDCEPNLIVVPHHRAHMSASFYTSGWDSATIIVVDGQGEQESVSIGHGEGRNINIEQGLPIVDSPGYFYEAVTEFIGFQNLDSGKTMGLASYGKPKYNLNYHCSNLIPSFKLPLANILPFEDNPLPDEQAVITTQWKEKIKKIVGKDPGKFAFNSWQCNLAASGQKSLEDAVVHIVNDVFFKHEGEKRLCYAGGVSLNCSINGKLIEENVIDKIHLFPAGDDAGVSLGAALSVAAEFDPLFVNKKLTRADLGAEFDNKDIRLLLNNTHLHFKKSEDVVAETAELIAHGTVVAWFQGRSEVGPRALGNRSILADPRIPGNVGLVNSLKGREQWRPFSPSILREHCNSFFIEDIDSPFMLAALTVRPEKRNFIPAVVHVDGTARPQTVDLTSNRRYRDLISKFYDITGIPILLNTSFNLRGEPIVCTPSDAIDTFLRSDLGVLVLQDFIVTK